MNQSTTQSYDGGVLAGLFKDAEEGDRALTELKSAGFQRVELSTVSSTSSSGERYGDDATASGTYGGSTAEARTSTRPFFQEHDSSASSFVRELEQLGFSKRDAHDLVEGVVAGAALVTVDAGDNAAGAAAVLNRYHGDVRYAGGGRMQPAAQAPLGAAAAATTAAATSELSDADREIQLRAERLVVNKQRVQHGEVRVRKVVVDEVQSIDVPVRREELVIERRAATGAAASGTMEPIGDQTIRIPLSEEQVSVSKQTVVREEVEIGKRRVEETQHVTDTVRHEELVVDDVAADAADRSSLRNKKP